MGKVKKNLGDCMGKMREMTDVKTNKKRWTQKMERGDGEKPRGWFAWPQGQLAARVGEEMEQTSEGEKSRERCKLNFSG